MPSNSVTLIGNLVDDPDDARAGGSILFKFDTGYFPSSITFVDIDQETAGVSFIGDQVRVAVRANDTGNNSVQTLDLSAFGAGASLLITFSSSGAIGEIEYGFRPTSVETESWGNIKARYKAP